MIVVDSSVWIDHFRNIENDRVTYLRARSVDEVLVGDLILLELLQGARDENHAAQLGVRLRQFPVVSLSDPELAIAGARNYRQLRARGITIRRTIDLIIATFCIERNHELLHRDRDFSPFARHLGLKIAMAVH